MKRFFLIVTVLILLCVCTACSSVEGDVGLITEARKHIDLSDAETVELRIIGSVEQNGHVLVWFVSGSENQTNRLFPMDFEVTGEDTYRFVHTYTSMSRGDGIGIAYWQNMYVFAVIKEDYAMLKLEDATGNIYDIAIENVPFVYNCGFVPTAYSFLDRFGDDLLSVREKEQ